MNPLIMLFFVIAVLMVLFIFLFSFFKVIFFSFGQGVQQSFGDILFSPGTIDSSSAVPVFLSAILASVISVVILIVGAITFIRRKKW